MLLALLAIETVAVLPFTAKAEASKTLGIAVAESALDVVVQANRDNFITLKQLDAVLRRRDLALEDPKVAGHVAELSRTLGATQVVVGEVSVSGGEVDLKARLLAMP